MIVRRFLAFVFSIVLVTGLNAGLAAAQYAPVSPVPQQEGDLGWCTIQFGEPTVCGFASPSDACQRQIQSYFPSGSRRFTGVFFINDMRAGCKAELINPLTDSGHSLGVVTKGCAANFENAGPTCRIVDMCTDCVKDQEVGNPINVITGQKKETRTDFQSADGRFVMKRFYNHGPFVGGTSRGMVDMFGNNWFLGAYPTITLENTHSVSFPGYRLSYPTGLSTYLRGSELKGALFIAGRVASPFQGRFTDGLIAPVNGQARSMAVVKNNGVEYHFDIPDHGPDLSDVQAVVVKPHRVDYGEGYFHNFAYNPEGRLTSITDIYGRTATFEYVTVEWKIYDAAGNIVDQILDSEEGSQTPRAPTETFIRKITYPDDTYRVFDYDYVSPFNEYWGVPERLSKATKYNVDSTKIEEEIYHYEDARMPWSLTGITDDAGIRFASWTYDARGRANSSEHAGGVDRVELSYTDRAKNTDPGTTTVTNALGHSDIYNSGGHGSLFELTTIEREGTTLVDAASRTMDYNNAIGGTKEEIDNEGREKNITRNQRGFPLTETYAVGTPDQFTTTYEWHERFRRPTKTIEPGLTTDYIYDAEGRLETMTQTDTRANPDAPRTWDFNWFGPQLATIDGPLPGNGDVIGFEHVNEKLTRVINEVGHVTNITAHNKVGAPATIIDPNGVETVLRYDARDRIERITRAGAETNITYSATDLVTSITLPNGSSLTFIYDDARRLMAIKNAEDERIDYTRNLMGGIESTNVSDAGGTIHYQIGAAFDEINRVIEATGVNSLTKFAYDKVDNVKEITDPRDNKWVQNFDNLDRLKSEVNPLGGVVDYQMDAQMDARNPLSGVTDERGISTTYIRNGYGEVVQEISAEAGATTYIRDEAGRITQMTDGRGIVSNYTYDVADRLLTVTYPAAKDNVTYDYDQGTFGIGELTTVTENFGVTTYEYDNLGHMRVMNRSIFGVDYETRYDYDLAGEVMAITYPTGTMVSFARDNAARITAVTVTQADNTVTNVAANIGYKPFGPVNAMTYGDGHQLSIDYDANYRATRLLRAKNGLSLMDLDFTYDPASDITAMNDNVRQARSQGFGYDALSRLTSADGGYGSINYSYNEGGDRTYRDWSRTDGTLQEERYVYSATSQRLLTVQDVDLQNNRTPKRKFRYADGGQLLHDERIGASTDIYKFLLNSRGRVRALRENGTNTAFYNYDESEQRVTKRGPEGYHHYHYDTQGRLIAETKGANGNRVREYIWLGLMPIAVIDNTGVHYLHADHLGRPQFATDSDGSIVWDMGGEVTPFGEGVNLAGAFAQRLMFPGQYADLETGTDITLSHNWHRTYDPTLGRYLQSDPIGLTGGFNRYAYVGGNPMGRIDPDGQVWWGIGFGLLDFGMQMWKHKGNINCVDFISVGMNLLGGGLIGKSFRKTPGKEFSHWFPDRYFRPLSLSGKNPNPHYKPLLDKYFNKFANSRLNGNYVKPKFHGLTDDFRYVTGMTKADKWPKWAQQIFRVPGWIPGVGFVGTAAATDFSRDNCECRD